MARLDTARKANAITQIILPYIPINLVTIFSFITKKSINSYPGIINTNIDLANYRIANSRR